MSLILPTKTWKVKGILAYSDNGSLIELDSPSFSMKQPIFRDNDVLLGIIYRYKQGEVSHERHRNVVIPYSQLQTKKPEAIPLLLQLIELGDEIIAELPEHSGATEI